MAEEIPGVWHNCLMAIEPGKQFESKLSWQDITEKHPDYAEDEGIHWASHVLATGDEEVFADEYEPVYKKTMVPVKSIANTLKFDPTNSRMSRALQGYRSGADIPPVVLVHKDGIHEISDGNHRVAAARHLGLTHIPAYVADAEELKGLQ